MDSVGQAALGSHASPCAFGSACPSTDGTGRVSSGGGNATFSFGHRPQRLGLRTRCTSQDSSSCSPPPLLGSQPAPSDTPVLFGISSRRHLQRHASPLGRGFKQHLLTAAPPPRNSCDRVFSSPALIAHILQALHPLEVRQATRLCMRLCRAAAVAWRLLAFSDLDLCWTETDGEAGDYGRRPASIEAALTSLSPGQLAGLRRLVATPAVLECRGAALDALSGCPQLAFLILTLQGSAGDDMFAPAADLWPNLHRLTQRIGGRLVCLDVSQALVQDSHLAAIGQGCPSLRALDLSYNPLLTATGVADLLATAGGSLEELDMSSCPGAYEEEALGAVGRGCPALHSLYLEHDAAWLASSPACRAAGLSAAPPPLHAAALALVATGCPKLQLVSLAGQAVAEIPPDSTAPVLHRLVHNCSALTSLDLSGCAWVGRAECEALCAAAPPPEGGLPLSSLHLAGGDFMDDRLLARLSNALGDNLQCLALDRAPGVTLVGVSQLLKACPNLVQVKLHSISTVVEPSALHALVVASHPGLVYDIIGAGAQEHCDLMAASPPLPSPLADRTNLASAVAMRAASRAGKPGERDLGQSGDDGQQGEKQQWGTLLAFLAEQAGSVRLT